MPRGGHLGPNRSCGGRCPTCPAERSSALLVRTRVFLAELCSARSFRFVMWKSVPSFARPGGRPHGGHSPRQRFIAFAGPQVHGFLALAETTAPYRPTSILDRGSR